MKSARRRRPLDEASRAVGIETGTVECAVLSGGVAIERPGRRYLVAWLEKGQRLRTGDLVSGDLSGLGPRLVRVGAARRPVLLFIGENDLSDADIRNFRW